MKIAKELITIEDGNDTIYYNYFTNYFIKVNQQVDKLIQSLSRLKEFNVEEFKSLVNTDNDDLLNYLIDQDIIISDIDSYAEKNYMPKFLTNEANFQINTVYLHPTLNCNFNCEYCYNRDNLGKYNDLDISNINIILNKLKKLGVKKLIITGGEPTVYKHLPYLLEQAKINNFEITLLTNGTSISNISFFEYVDLIIVSLDGLSIKENNMYRKNQLNIDIFNNITSLGNKYREKIQIRSVLTNQNVEQICKLRTECEKYNIKHIVSLFCPNGKADLSYIPTVNSVMPLYKNSYSLPNYCGAGHHELAILPNGDIYPCQSLIKKELLITNILKKDYYQDIINSKICQKFVLSSSFNNIECRNCKYKFLCGGPCKANLYNLNKNLDEPFTAYCEVIKKRIKNYIRAQFKTDNINERSFK